MKVLRVLIILNTFLLSFAFEVSSQSTSWQQAKSKQKATLNIHWYVSQPFIYKTDSETPEGLEVEILTSFQKYVQEKHTVDLKLNWVESKNFSDILKSISNTSSVNSFGSSAFSITEERKNRVQFTNPYLSDVAVLISSEDTPIVRRLDEISKMMKQMVAITIKGTTYEQFLLNIKKQLSEDFEIQYIKSDKNILDAIREGSNRFGFIDLPIYLMHIKKGGELTRQNFFTVKGNGYAFILPPKSDWHTVFNAFLAEPETSVKIANITSKYIGSELYNFIDGIYSEDNLNASILTKEKEIQLEQLKIANSLIEKEKNNQITTVVIAVITTLLLAIIIILFYKEQKVSRILIRKNKQIELQQQSIKNKNKLLSNSNLQLTSLNEEKNNLVKILAHDLRTPINQISGLLDILKLSNKDFSKKDEEIIIKAKDSVQRLNHMISKILDFDALEGNRLKVIPEKIEICEIFKKIEQELMVVSEKKDIKIKYDAKDEESFVTDHLFLTQILQNIIVNAIKFSEPESEIFVKGQIENGKVLFSVKDEGPGMNEEDKKIIFKKFQKLSAKPTNGENSTGLGLSIVKKYVDLLEGEVWVESEKNEGSTFYVSLPLNS